MNTMPKYDYMMTPEGYGPRRWMPNTEVPQWVDQFVYKSYAAHQADIESRSEYPVVRNTSYMVPGFFHMPIVWGSKLFDGGLNPFNRVYDGLSMYDTEGNPVFPRTPNPYKGELVQGAQLHRTSVWHKENEPALVSVAKYEPGNIRHRAYFQNLPVVETTMPPGVMDRRLLQLPEGHASRQSFLLFSAALMFGAYSAFIKVFVFELRQVFRPLKTYYMSGELDVDVTKVELGDLFIGKISGQPLFVVHRTPDMIASAKKDDAVIATMRDPQLDSDRAPNPDWLVCMGVCTHLGCQPGYLSGDYGAFFCSCHGSHYDWSGRIRRGPAPLNLQVPGYKWASDEVIAVG